MNSLMTIEQAWIAQLILLEGVWHFCKERLDEDASCIGRHIAAMNVDFEYFDDWCNYCRNHLEDKFSEQVLMSSNEALQMVAGYNFHLYKRFGFSISKLVVLFDSMRSAPELCSTELELWNKAVMRAIEKERRREDPSICGFACEGYERCVGTTPQQASGGRNVIYFFLEYVLQRKKEEFEERGVGLGAFLTFVTGSELEDYTWRREYTKEVDRDFLPNNKIYPDQVFSIMYGVLSKYQNKYGFELCGVLRLLRSMREEPAEHEEEWKLWRNAWERARSGECLGWIDYTYVEKES